MKNRIIMTMVLLVILCFYAPVFASLASEKEYIVVFKKGISWEEAVAEANHWGSSYHLATITSRQEQKNIQSILRGVHGEFWIGGYQDGQNRWQWVTGEPWRFNKWGGKEPNDFYGSNSEQRLAIWGRNHKNQWKWNDEGNLGNISGFILEKEPGANVNPSAVPIPGAGLLLGSGAAALLMLRRRSRRGAKTGCGREEGFKGPPQVS